MFHLVSDTPWWFWLVHLCLPVVWAFAASVLAAWLQLKLASRALSDLPSDAHWSARARLLWPIRRILAMGAFLWAVFWGVFALFFVHTPVGVWSRAGLAISCAASAGAAGLLVSQWLARRQRPWTLWQYLRGQMVATLLRMPHMVLLGVLMLLVSSDMNAWQWALYSVGVLVALMLALRGGLPILRIMGWARQPSARVMSVVSDTAARVGVTPRRVWEVDWPVANAFAYILSQEVVISVELHEALNDSELGSIIAHELGHLSEPRGVVIARMAPVLALLVVLMLLPLALQGHVWIYVAAVVFLLVLVVVTGRTRRKMEERADDFGQAHEEDPGVYARALEKIYRHNMVPAVLGLKRAAHPDLYDRLEAAGVEPDYPRPEPPPTSRLPRLVGAAVHLLMLVALVLPPFFLPPVSGLGAVDETLAWTHLAFGGDRFGALVALGRAASGKGDASLELRANQALDELEEHTNPSVSHSRFYVLVRLGRCEEARQALVETQRRLAVMDDPALTLSSPAPTEADWKLVDDCEGLPGLNRSPVDEAP